MYFPEFNNPNFFFLYGHSSFVINETRVAFAGGQVTAILLNPDIFGQFHVVT